MRSGLHAGSGSDFGEKMIEIARSKYPGVEFRVGDIEDERTIEELEGPFDYIVLSDVVGYLEDCETTFVNLHKICTPSTRLVVAYYSQALGTGVAARGMAGREDASGGAELAFGGRHRQRPRPRRLRGHKVGVASAPPEAVARHRSSDQPVRRHPPPSFAEHACETIRWRGPC